MLAASISVSILFVFAIIIAIVVFIVTIVASKKKKKKKKVNAPLLTLQATVASKKYDYNGGSIVCCVSFDVAGQGRIELPVPADQFDRLNEGDFGTLTYQDDQFFSFTRW